MKTFLPKENEINKVWHVVDANNKVLGRLASEIAFILRGKNKPIFTPFMDTGDNVIVINAEKVKLTGKKWTDKIYYRHTLYPGGIRSQSATEIKNKHPERLVMHAVKGMLPKNILGSALLRNLRVYAGPEHPHKAQKPNKLSAGE